MVVILSQTLQPPTPQNILYDELLYFSSFRLIICEIGSQCVALSGPEHPNSQADLEITEPLPPKSLI